MLLALSLALNAMFSHAQTTVEVSDPRLEFRDNRLLVSYDIAESDPGEKYIIAIDFRDGEGNVIGARTLEGDFGMVESGGPNKLIVWNLAADSVFIQSYVYVTLNARMVPAEEPVTELKESNPVDGAEELEKEEPAVKASLAASCCGVRVSCRIRRL